MRRSARQSCNSCQQERHAYKSDAVGGLRDFIVNLTSRSVWRHIGAVRSQFNSCEHPLNTSGSNSVKPPEASEISTEKKSFFYRGLTNKAYPTSVCSTLRTQECSRAILDFKKIHFHLVLTILNKLRRKQRPCLLFSPPATLQKSNGQI